MGNNASLHESCRTGDLDGLAQLLASSETADVEKADEDGRTALLVAAGSDPEVKSPSPTPQALESDTIKAAAHSVQHEKKQI
ncbi:hypothetical protein SPRG_14532, partial [Saprolegnia parasitica CBS 223.65]